eukprot:3581585-Pyramimonas_sp.AAC.1
MAHEDPIQQHAEQSNQCNALQRTAQHCQTMLLRKRSPMGIVPGSLDQGNNIPVRSVDSRTSRDIPSHH